ncbi:MAG: hypothetical protein Q9227_004836 [Pyrenula ochraceoflavens]
MEASIPPGDIGFIGVGAMGRPMLGHLVERFSPQKHIYIYDVVPSLVQDTCKDNPQAVSPANSPKEIAERCRTIFTMVPEGPDSRTVYLDPSTGLLSTPNPNPSTLYIDCSTIDLSSSRAIASAVHSTHPSSSYYDAPVSGGVIGAQKGTLSFFLGCSDTDPKLPTLESLLSCMGSTIIPCGAPTYGLAAKLSNNYMSGLLAILVSEAFQLGMSAGLSPPTLHKVFKSGTGQSTIADKFCPVPGVVREAPSSRDYQGGFRVQLMRKDVGLAVAMGKEGGVELGFAERGLEVYEKACEDERCRGRDNRVVYRHLGGKEDWEGREEWERNGYEENEKRT